MRRAPACVAMLRAALVAAPALVWADPSSPDFSLGGAAELALRADGLYDSGSTPAASSGAAASGLGSLSALSPLGLGADDGGGGSSMSYMAVRTGPLFFLGDLEDLGTGWTIEAAFGIQPVSFLAIEIQSGYFWGEDENGSTQADLWGVPLVVNAKLRIPILIVGIYGGVGVGGYYIDGEIDTPIGDDSEADFVFGGNAFVGVDVTLGPVFVGVEGKYILTADVDAPGSGTYNLEGFAAMAVVGFKL